MIEELQELRRQATTNFEAASTSAELKVCEAQFLGKKGQLAALQQRIGTMSPDEKREFGAVINETRATVKSLFDAATSRVVIIERAVLLEKERLDLTEFLPPRPLLGTLHPISIARQQLEDVFLGMGFTVADGPEVEDDWHNFGALNMPHGHPARSGFDTMFVDYGDEPESVMLRTHTSPVQIRLMEAKQLPIYSIMPGKVYRRDTPDARHLSAFHQIEGLVVDKGVTFGDLAGCINLFTKAFFGEDISARLRPASFPFTEPSAEYDISCTVCRSKGCRTCSGTGWVELGGCGLVHPNVLRAVEIDPEEYSGFAFGFGIDRLAQMRASIPDMRAMLDNDIRFLSQFA